MESFTVEPYARRKNGGRRLKADRRPAVQKRARRPPNKIATPTRAMITPRATATLTARSVNRRGFGSIVPKVKILIHRRSQV